MKRRTILKAGSATLAWPLAGCGGGAGGLLAAVGSGGTGIDPGGVGSGGTGVRVTWAGPIDGFGSIIVNGVRFDIDAARLLLQDIDALRLGVTVLVDGTLGADGLTGTADQVRSAADLRGVVDSVAAAGFTLLGVPVTTDEGTVWSGGLPGLAGLRAGEVVQVHGVLAASGLLATRVERLAQAATPIVGGVVASLDTSAQTFRLGAATVRYAGATLDTSLANGRWVRVRASGVANGALLATRIDPWLAAAEGTQLTVSGLALDFTSPGAFVVEGQPVDASQAQVTGGPASRLVAGARVDVTGVLRSGVLVASRVRLRSGNSGGNGNGNSGGNGNGNGNSGGNGNGGAADPGGFSASGTIGAFRSAADFRVQGQRIDASGSGVVFAGGTAADLGNGRRVLVTGAAVVDDVLVAQRVEFQS